MVAGSAAGMASLSPTVIERRRMMEKGTRGFGAVWVSKGKKGNKGRRICLGWGRCRVRGCAGELGESCFLVSKGEGLCGLGETRESWLPVDERERGQCMGLLPAEGEEALMLLLGERAEPLVGSVEKKNQAREVQAVWPVSKEKKNKSQEWGAAAWWWR